MAQINNFSKIRIIFVLFVSIQTTWSHVIKDVTVTSPHLNNANQIKKCLITCDAAHNHEENGPHDHSDVLISVHEFAQLLYLVLHFPYNHHHKNVVEYSLLENMKPTDDYDTVVKKLEEHPIYSNNLGKYIWVPFSLLQYLQKARDNEEKLNTIKHGLHENEKDEKVEHSQQLHKDEKNDHEMHEHEKNSQESHKHEKHDHERHEHEKNSHESHKHKKNDHEMHEHEKNSHESHENEKHDLEKHEHEKNSHESHKHEKHDHERHEHEKNSHESHKHEKNDHEMHEHEKNSHESHKDEKHDHEKHEHEKNSHESHKHEKHDHERHEHEKPSNESKDQEHGSHDQEKHGHQSKNQEHGSHDQEKHGHKSHEQGKVLISLKEFARLVYSLLHSSNLHHHKLCNFDLLKHIKPTDNYDTIVRLLEHYTHGAQQNPIYTINNKYYLWVPYSLLKCIQTTLDADHKPQPTAKPVFASKKLPKNWRYNCKKYAKAYENLKKAEKAFYHLRNGEKSSESNEHKYHSSKQETTLHSNKISIEDIHSHNSYLSGDEGLTVVAKKIGE